MIKWHIFLSTMALIVMGLAGLQAVLLALQDYFLRLGQSITLKYFPSIETMEKWLFRIISLGFFLLSLLVISSLLTFHPIWATPFRQKFILTMGAWAVFMSLLLGRYYWGWRGRTAIRWTLVGVFLLLTIYCGTGLLVHVDH